MSLTGIRLLRLLNVFQNVSKTQKNCKLKKNKKIRTQCANLIQTNSIQVKIIITAQNHSNSFAPKQFHSAVILGTAEKDYNDLEEDTVVRYKNKKIITQTKSISVQKEKITVEIPVTHDLVTKTDCRHLRKKYSK